MAPTRRLLALALPAAALAPAGARAFRIEALPAGEAGRADAACGAGALHEAMRDELDRAFGARLLPPEVERALEAASRCPYCGCAVVGRADHGERAPPRG